MSTTNINELRLIFLVGPLDDLCDSKDPVLPKWKVKQCLHQLIEDYVEKLIEEGEHATVVIAAKKHETPMSLFGEPE